MSIVSKETLRNDQNIAGPHIDVGRHVAAPDQILESDRILSATGAAAQDSGTVARGEIGQPTDRDHDVEKRHVLPVRQRLRFRGFADDPNLLAVRANKTGDNDSHDRVADEFAEDLFDVASDLG